LRSDTSHETSMSDSHALNALCPYYTMFPIDFPLRHLEGIDKGDWVFDPFCGRGTTAFAARLRGVNSVGLDVNPVAVAIARAKLVSSTPGEIVRLAELAIRNAAPDRKPRGDFWDHAFHPSTLNQILKVRAYLRTASGPIADALRGVILGALHGPQPKYKNSYLSNHMQRTFAPKPDYAVKYWRQNKLRAREVDVLSIVRERASRFYAVPPPQTQNRILHADARHIPVRKIRFAATITSPPYFGMSSYVPDQWLRGWFLGGQAKPVYGVGNQLAQGDWVAFVNALSRVWRQVAVRSKPGARLVIRFGSLPSRQQDPEMMIRFSLADSAMPWRISSIRRAGDANRGRRQGKQMGRLVHRSQALEEIDVVCRLS
jgi:hypothetical protein